MASRRTSHQKCVHILENARVYARLLWILDDNGHVHPGQLSLWVGAVSSSLHAMG